MGKGASAVGGPGYSAEPEPVPVSALRASIPSADDAQAVRDLIIVNCEHDAKWRARGAAALRTVDGLVGRIEDLQLALSWALGELIQYEPGDSRAVSNEFVSAAVIEADCSGLEQSRAILAQAIEARRAETQSGSVHESAVPEGDAPQ